MKDVREMGFSMSSVFRYGLDFFYQFPELALEWEEAQARERIEEIWKRGTRKSRPPAQIEKNKCN